MGVSLIGLGVNPLLAGLKHNNRLEQVLIKQDIEQQMVDDCIVLDCHGHIVEMCAANIFGFVNNVFSLLSLSKVVWLESSGSVFCNMHSNIVTRLRWDNLS